MSFISVKDTNIKLSNIKQFGISSELIGVDVPIYQKDVDASEFGKELIRSITKLNFWDDKYKFTGKYMELTPKKYTNQRYIDDNLLGRQDDFFYIGSSPEDVIKRDFERVGYSSSNKFDKKVKPKEIYSKYLYITTYQNDNFRFYDDEIDVNKKHEEIKSRMS